MSEPPYDWTWGQDGIHVLGSFMGQHLAFMSYDDMGCSLLSEIDATANEVTFSCGYRLNALPALGAKHFDTQNGVVDDDPFDVFSRTGVVLLVFATQQHIDFHTPEPGEGFRLFISDMTRVAKTAGEIDKPEVYFEDVSLEVDNPECPDYMEICWRQVEPAFMVCWDSVKTGRRAYQLICPRLQNRSGVPESECETFIHPGFHHEFYGYGSEFVKGLGVYWPLLDQYIHKPSPLDETLGIKSLIEFIDEVLPGP